MPIRATTRFPVSRQRWPTRASTTSTSSSSTCAITRTIASHARRWLDAEGEPTATHPLVAQIATQMLAMEARVKANIVAEAQSFLNLYSDPVIGANIASSDFNLDRICGNGDVSLYFVVHPADKKRLRAAHAAHH